MTSTSAQGVPLLITDPVTLSNIGGLLKPRAGLGSPDAGGLPGTVAASHHPQGLNPVGVESASTVGGVDDGVVKDGSNDGRLTVQVQLRPRLA